MPVVWQNKSIKIKTTYAHFQQDFQIKNPSKENGELLKLRDIKISAYKKYLEGKQWNVEDGSELLEKEAALLHYQEKLIQFATNTTQFLPAMAALRWVSPENDYERVPEFLFNQCEKWKQLNNKHSWLAQLCAQSKKSVLPLLKGDVFPNTKLPTVLGDTLIVNSILGSKLTVIDLWASWCVPCRKENREILLPLYEKYHNKGLQIVGYGLESDRQAWQAAIAKDQVAWVQTSHLQGDDTPFLKMLRIQTIPANFILDNKGVVIAKNLHGNELIKFVEAYFKRWSD